MAGNGETSFGSAYRSFLGLYWMTAPLAWLYAIPVERFLSPAGAVRANLWLLGIVAAWRVALMVRVVSVLFRTSAGRALFPVLLFADTVALALLYLTPLPVVSLMGGIRLSKSEQLIQATAFLVGALGIVSWPLWLIGTITVAARKGATHEATVSAVPGQPVSSALCGLGGLSLVVWLAILPLTQPEQQLRRRVENDLRQGRIQQALQVMSAHERSDFPPHWDPPPRVGYGEDEPPLLDVMEAVIATDARPWVAELYWEKFRNHLHQGYYWLHFWEEMDDAEFDRHLTILESLPEDSPLLAEQRETLTYVLTEGSRRTPSQRERLRTLLEEKPAE